MKGKFASKRNNMSDSTVEKTESASFVVESLTAENESNEVAVQLDELAKLPPVKNKRVWEVDFVRGLMILFVVWDHFMWGRQFYRSRRLQNSPVPMAVWIVRKLLRRRVAQRYPRRIRNVVRIYFGNVVQFSRSNGRRAIKMIAFACLFTAVTAAITAIIGINLTINFNVIHVIALSVLLWAVIEWCWAKCKKNWQKNIFGCVMLAVTLTALIVGACALHSPWTDTNPAWFFLGGA